MPFPHSHSIKVVDPSHPSFSNLLKMHLLQEPFLDTPHGNYFPLEPQKMTVIPTALQCISPRLICLSATNFLEPLTALQEPSNLS